MRREHLAFAMSEIEEIERGDAILDCRLDGSVVMVSS